MALAATLFLLIAFEAHAQVVPAQNQVIPSAYFGQGYLISTSTTPTHKLGASLVDLAGSFITGVLGVPRGGTGSSTLTGILIGNGTSVVRTLIIGSNLSLIGTTLSATGFESPLTFTYPLVRTSNTISLAFGTTTSNIWGGVQTFTNSPTFSTLGAGTVNSTSGGTIYNTATSTATIGTGLSYSGTWGQFISGISGTLSNTGVISNSCPGGFLSCSGTNPSTFTLGTLTVANGGTGTTTLPAGQVLYGGGSGVYQSRATTTVSCSGSVSCSGFDVLGNSPITITGVATGSGLATSSPIASSNLLVYSSVGAGSAYGVATSTLTASSPLTGSFTQIGSGGVLGCQTASGSQAGCLSVADWMTFNNKISSTSLSATSPIFYNSSTGIISSQPATTGQNGYLTSTDWNTFNGKQPAGNYITALTGDVTATGPGSVAATLATVNGNVGSFTNASITVNGKGLITAASSGAAPVTSVTGTYPIISSGGATPAISIAFGTTTSNTWAGTQTFTNSPVFSTLTAGTVNSTAGGTIYNTATTSVANGTGISFTGTPGALIGGSNLTITNSSPLSGLSTSFPLSFSNPTLSWIGLATTSNISAGQAIYATGVNTIAGTATTSVSCSGTVSCTGFNVLGASPITITGTGAASDEKWATSTLPTAGIYPNSALYVGIGTTTPRWQLQLASSTAPQLALSDGSLTDSHWTFRNNSGELDIATTSPSTFTTTASSVLALGNTGYTAIDGTPQSSRELTVFNGGDANADELVRTLTSGGYAAILFQTPAGSGPRVGMDGSPAVLQSGGFANALVVQTGGTSPIEFSGSASLDAIIDTSGRFGIGSSTPGSLFSVGGNTTGTNFYDNATTTKSGTGGYNIATGCYAIGGTCISGGGGGAVSSVSNSDSTLTISPTTGAVVAGLNLANANTWTARQTFNAGVSVTTTNGSPWYAIDGALFAYASSTNKATVLGLNAGGNNATTSASASQMVAIGYQALTALTTGQNNVGIGYQAAEQVTTGARNIMIGSGTGFSVKTTSDNVYIGNNAGNGAGSSNGKNIAIGSSALNGGGGASSQSGDISIGYQSGLVTLSGGFNVFLGYQAGAGVTTGQDNILLATATSSTAIANLTTGSQNVMIGANISFPSATASGQLNIQNIIFGTGNSAISTNVSVGKIGIATTTPWRTFSVAGTQSWTGLTAASAGNAICINATTNDVENAGTQSCTVSSRRFKENIKTLTPDFALKELNKLHVVSFDYKPGDYSPEDSPHAYGLIAEDVEDIDPSLVDMKYDGTAGAIFWDKVTGLNVQAIQELDKRVSVLESQKSSQAPQSKDLGLWGVIALLVAWNLYLTFRKK